MGTAHAKLSAYFTEQVEALGGQAQPIDPRGHKGRCDRFAVFHRKSSTLFYFVELKTGEDTVKPWQQTEHDTLRAKGFTVRVLHERDGVDYFIREVKHRLR